MATTTIRIGPADHGRAMTIREFLDAEVEEGYRYELARGVLEVTDIPGEPHGLIEWFLLGRIRDYERDHPGLIHRAGGPDTARIWLPGMVSGRNPDVAVVIRHATRDLTNRRRPALVFEVVSPGREARERDYTIKREEYLAYGILEYWIVDPIDRRVVVLVRDGDAWIERVFDGDQAATGLVLPGFEVRPADLWATAEADDEGTPDG